MGTTQQSDNHRPGAERPRDAARARPNRPLTPSETLRIAELQANHLLRHFAIETPAVPEEIISELPRIRVEREHDLAVSGAAYWNGRNWVIAINADEPPSVSGSA